MRIRLSLFVKTVSLMVLMLFTHHIYAEYYFVPPGEPPVIWLDGSSHVKKKYKRKYHRTYAHQRKSYACSKNRADISVYYINNVPTCCTCYEVWIQGRFDCYSAYIPVRTDWRRYDSDYYVGNRYEAYDAWYPYQDAQVTYNPDLTTGDDDTWVDPNMDIND